MLASMITSIAVFSQQPDTSRRRWFPFIPSTNIDGGNIGMQSWLDGPAGRHGFVQMKDDKLVFEDGLPVTFWGTNICSQLPFTDKARADSFVNFVANYGVNAIRFHKFSWYTYHNDSSTELDPEKFDRFDYFQASLRNKGIYYGWSHIYGHRVLPADSTRLLAYAEIKNLSYPWSHLNGSTSSLVNFAPDLQQLSIDLTVNMLNHVNPYTGLRYADDPALAFIEFQNEDNIFWSAIGMSLKQAPTYRKLLCEQFSQWLKDKYGSQEALEKAWGTGNIPEGESLEAMNIFPNPNHSVFSAEYESALKEMRPMARHILDKMRFLYERQLDFYQKFERAVRATGYRGLLVGSCWQAGSGISHMYNLHADYEVGMIDRHNYYGGGAGGHRIQVGEVKNGTQLSSPASGLLSTGLQDVVDRPFSFSEWMSLVPNEWTAETAPLIAVYGMGLQGWDASFSFATDIPRFSSLLQSEAHGVYNATSPLHIGLYPALARMVYRHDITEGPVLATRNVHVPSLADGKLGFNEWVDQGYDDKQFSGTIPAEMLAIGRFPIAFTNEFTATDSVDVSTYWNRKSMFITSATGELSWSYGEKKYVAINTDGTKGIIGFAPNEGVSLGVWKVKVENPFAVVLITDISKNGNLQQADSILITTVARARNTDMEYSYHAGSTMLNAIGREPLLLEPVVATIETDFPPGTEIIALDHSGAPTSVRLPIIDGHVRLEGEKYKTMYYLVIQKKNKF